MLASIGVIRIAKVQQDVCGKGELRQAEVNPYEAVWLANVRRGLNS